MDKETRQNEAIEMLLTIYDSIVENNPCVMDNYTMVKDCKPDSLKFVIKEAILAIAYS